MRYRWKCGEVLWPITSTIKLALSAEVWRCFCGPKVPNMGYRWKYDESLWPTTPSIKHALSGDAFAAKKYQLCVIGESAAKFCGPQLQVSSIESFVPWLITAVSNMRYRLKFGDAFAAQTYQICVIGESELVRWKFVAHNSKYQTCVICWSLATLLRPQSTKYALSVKVRRSFVAHNSNYETCVIGRSLAMLLLPKSTR